MKEMNYEQAIVEFQKILEIEPKNVDAYIGLAEAYVGLGYTDKAIETLEKGYENTDNERIENKIREIHTMAETTAESVVTTMEPTITSITATETETTADITTDASTTTTTSVTPSITMPSGSTTLERVEFKHGKVDGTVYTNDLISAKVEFDSGWTYISDEDLASMNGISDFSMDSTDSAFKTNGVLYDMFASNDEGDNINVLFENLNRSNNASLDEQGYVDAAMVDLKSQLEMQFTVDSIEQKKITFLDSEVPCLKITLDIMGTKLYECQTYKKVGQYMCVFTATASSSEMAENILKNFTVISNLPTTTNFEPENVNLGTVFIAGEEYSIADTTELYIYIGDISSYNDIISIGKLVNLKKLYLASDGVTDITPLANLTNLTWLSLSVDGITDIAPLANLTNLTFLELILCFNETTDITPLANLTNLTYLLLWDEGREKEKQITDISPLSSLTNLTNLGLWCNGIKDITPLANLNNLIKLELLYSDISDFTPLANHDNLTELHLSKEQINETDLETIRYILPNCNIQLE